MGTVFPRPESDPVATAGLTAEAAARVAADAFKQDAATAATDAELTAAHQDLADALSAAINAEADGRHAEVLAEASARVAALGLKQDAATAATDAELAAETTARTGADALKQDASTAATDSELATETTARTGADSTESAARVAADALKQDASSAATDSELAGETSRATTAEAGKQDAATAATDAELAAAVALRALQPSAVEYGPNVAALPTAFDTPRQNTTGRNLLMVIRAGIVSQSGENGHIYFETSPNNSVWTISDGLGFRNNQPDVGTAQVLGKDTTDEPQVGIMKGLIAIVPVGYWYRLRTTTITGFAAPAYVLDGPNWMSYGVLS